MLTYTLSRLMAVVPSAVKYRLGRLKPLYTRLLAARRGVAPVAMAPGRVRWQIDGLTSQRHLLATYEPHMQQALQTWVRPGDVVYDVGAHAGFHALFAALLVGPSGRVFAFEPHPENLASVSRQLALNPQLPVTAVPYALSDRAGSARLAVPGNTSQGFLAADGEVPIEARTLDGLLATGALPPPRVIKIDVEGHEAAVLHGARETIRTHRPVILCDYNDAETAATVAGALAGLGYEVRSGPPVVAAPADAP